MLPIITIDGPAGVGKSTIAALVADRFRLPFLNTGAMYRFLALTLGTQGLNASREELSRLTLHFSLKDYGEKTRLFVNEREIGEEIRAEEIGALASRIAVRPEIRQLLLEAQRELGRRQPLVAEGRDTGTIVFPEAAFKFFLDAEPEVRAKRRWLELTRKGGEISLEELTAKIRQRDHLDRTRREAPLRPAPDALNIDTSFLTTGEVLDRITGRIDYICSENPRLKSALFPA